MLRIASATGAHMSLNIPFACKNSSIGGRIMLILIFNRINIIEDFDNTNPLPTHIDIIESAHTANPKQQIDTIKNVMSIFLNNS